VAAFAVDTGIGGVTPTAMSLPPLPLVGERARPDRRRSSAIAGRLAAAITGPAADSGRAVVVEPQQVAQQVRLALVRARLDPDTDGLGKRTKDVAHHGIGQYSSFRETTSCRVGKRNSV
jgi:hypothetical protein